MPGMWGNGMRLQGCMKQGSPWFGALACRTSFNVLTHITTHAWPVVIPRYQLQRLVMSRMSGDSSIVMQSDDIPMQSAILQNIDMSLECDDLVTIHPVVRVSEMTFDGGIVLIVMHLSDPINDRGG